MTTMTIDISLMSQEEVMKVIMSREVRRQRRPMMATHVVIWQQEIHTLHCPNVSYNLNMIHW